MADNIFLKTFGARARELRRAQGVTQKDLAELLGCTVSNYQKMEYGQVNVPATTVAALADHYGVSADYLLGRTEEKG